MDVGVTTDVKELVRLVISIFGGKHPSALADGRLDVLDIGGGELTTLLLSSLADSPDSADHRAWYDFRDLNIPSAEPAPIVTASQLILRPFDSEGMSTA